MNADFEKHEMRLSRELSPRVLPSARDRDLAITEAADPSNLGGGGEINAALLRHTWRRWWYVCLPMGIVLAALAIAGIWLFFEPVYEAVAWLKIESVSPFLAFPDDDHRYAGPNGDIFVRTQMELIRSPIVLGPVLQDPQVASIPEIQRMENPVRALAKTISVKSETESELYQVSFEARSPRDAANLVNAVLRQYTRFHEKSGRERSERIIAILEQEVAARKIELTGMRTKVREATRQLTGEEPRLAAESSSAAAAVDRSPLNEWQTQLGSSEVERTVLEATLQMLQETSASDEATLPDALIQSYVDQQEVVQRQRAIVEEERERLDASAAVSRKGVDDPLLAPLRKRLTDAEAKLKEIESRAGERGGSVLSARARLDEEQQNKKKIRELQAKISSQQTLEALLTEKISDYRRTQQGAGEVAVNLEFARRDLARVDQVYELLVTRINELKTENRAPSRIEVLQESLVPQDPVEYLPWKKFGIGGVLGLFLPFFVALMWEFRARRVSEVAQLVSNSSPLLHAEITSLPTRPLLATGNSQRQYLEHRAAFEDSVHYLCRTLQLSPSASQLHTIALTSAVSGEGKTNLSVQLAISMAQCSREPVVLIDADIRSPDLHRAFGLPICPGLTEVLRGECQLTDALAKTSVDNLFLLPAGRSMSHPHRLLQHEKFGVVLLELRKMYEHIILDTPPALAVGESLSACALADGVLVCTLRDVSRQDQVQLLAHRLQQAGSKILGVVLSGTSPQRYASKYGSMAYHEFES